MGDTGFRSGISLTEEQSKVVRHVLRYPVTAVAAGAGSGKTHTLVATVIELVARKRYSIHDFALISFTNAAADELRLRMAKQIGEQVDKAVTHDDRVYWLEQEELLGSCFVGTIHSLCRWMLQTFGYEKSVAYASGVSMARSLLNQVMSEVLHNLLEEHGGKVLLEHFEYRHWELAAITRSILQWCYTHGVPLEDMVASTRGEEQTAVADYCARVDKAYTGAKTDDNQLDSQDLLVMTADTLLSERGPSIAEMAGKRFRCLFVDEYQDTDQLQKAIVGRLTPHLGRILLVGDGKQSIYAFRGADGCMQPEEPLSISQSRRPTKELLDLENRLYASIGDRYERFRDSCMLLGDSDAHAFPGSPMPFVFAGYSQRDEQIRCVGQLVQSYLRTQLFDPHIDCRRSLQPADIVIIARSNAIVREYARGLSELPTDTGIRFRAVTGGEFFLKPEVVDTCAILRVVIDPDNPAHTAQIKDAFHFAGFSDEQRSQIMNDLGRMARKDPPRSILGTLYDRTDVMDRYRNAGDIQAVANLELLRELAQELFDNEQALTLDTFVEYLEIARRTGREKSEADVGASVGNSSQDCVRVMTVHRAKGLEFPVVIIPGIDRPLASNSHRPGFLITPDNGLLLRKLDGPDYQAEWRRHRDELLSEEMRVLYVAVTRARYSVAFVGSARTWLNGKKSTFYSWQDEILRAWPKLTQEHEKHVRRNPGKASLALQ